MKTKLAVCMLAGLLALPAAVAVLGTTATTTPTALSAHAADTESTGALALVEDLVNEDIEDPALADLTGCDGLNVSVSEEGEASAAFYTWEVDEQTGEEYQAPCEPAVPEPPAAALIGALPVALVEDLVNEDVEDPTLAELTGCDGLHVTVTDAGEASAFFYTWEIDEETGEEFQAECDPLAE